MPFSDVLDLGDRLLRCHDVRMRRVRLGRGWPSCRSGNHGRFRGRAVAVRVGNLISVHLGIRLPRTDPGSELIGPRAAATLILIDVAVVVVPFVAHRPVLGVVIASGLAGSAFGFLQRVPV